MYIKYDKSLKCRSKLRCQLSTHHLYNFLNLTVNDITIGLHFSLAHVIKDFFDSLGPINLIDGKDNLTGPFRDPFSSLVVVIVLNRIEREKLERLSHDSFDLKHPLLDIAFLVTLVDINLSAQLDVFLFC